MRRGSRLSALGSRLKELSALGSRLSAGWLVVVGVGGGEVADAQAPDRPVRRGGVVAGSVDPVSVRAEYASTLLQARRYREAAREYRRLLEQHPEHFEWRLNYARALAWGGVYREAATELERLSARAPRNATVEELLASARANIEPTSREARAWVMERPSYTPYRLALARAYVREGRPRTALSHFDIVVARQPSPALFREAGDALLAAGDRRRAIALYRRAIERSPSDVVLRRSYAQALAANRQYGAAIEQYGVVLDARPDPLVLMERGDVRRRSGDEAGAERDLQASVALRPTSQGYLALGDMYRWRGQFKRARAAYERAAAFRPADRVAASRLAQLTREERPGFGYASTIDEQPGVTVASRVTADNTGFAYIAGEGRVGFPFGRGTVLGVGVEPRVIHDRSPGSVLADAGPARQIAAVGATLGLAHTYHGEDLDARVAARGGVAKHSSGAMMPLLAGSAVMTYRGAWSLSVEGTESPAYANLMTLVLSDVPSLAGSSSSSAMLASRTFAVAVAAPFGIADVGAEYESMWLTDGNTRDAFQFSVRLPLVAGVSLLYSGGSLGFAERSPLYWDPPEYVSHAVGVELGARNDAGLAFTARVLPGVGRAVEGLTAGDPSRFGEAQPGIPRFVGQLSATADLSLRRRRWETALGAAYGSGRLGGYRRWDGSLRVRYIP